MDQRLGVRIIRTKQHAECSNERFSYEPVEEINAL